MSCTFRSRLKALLLVIACTWAPPSLAESEQAALAVLAVEVSGCPAEFEKLVRAGVRLEAGALQETVKQWAGEHEPTVTIRCGSNGVRVSVKTDAAGGHRADRQLAEGIEQAGTARLVALASSELLETLVRSEAQEQSSSSAPVHVPDANESRTPGGAPSAPTTAAIADRATIQRPARFSMGLEFVSVLYRRRLRLAFGGAAVASTPFSEMLAGALTLQHVTGDLDVDVGHVNLAYSSLSLSLLLTQQLASGWSAGVGPGLEAGRIAWQGTPNDGIAYRGEQGHAFWFSPTVGAGSSLLLTRFWSIQIGLKSGMVLEPVRARVAGAQDVLLSGVWWSTAAGCAYNFR